MKESSSRPRGKSKSTQSFSPKDRIDHTVFGLGTIVTINPFHTTIAFDEQGTRKFVTSMVKLSPSDAPPPAKRVSKKAKAKVKPKAKAKAKAAKKATTKATKKTTTKATKKATTKATKKVASKAKKTKVKK